MRSGKISPPRSALILVIRADPRLGLISCCAAGSLVQVGTPEEVYEHPTSRFVAEFLGDANLLKPEAVGGYDGECRSVQLSGSTLKVVDVDKERSEDPVVMLRPEHIEIRMQPMGQAALKGLLVGSQFGGGLYRWQVKLPDGQLVAVRSTIDLGTVDN